MLLKMMKKPEIIPWSLRLKMKIKGPNRPFGDLPVEIGDFS